MSTLTNRGTRLIKFECDICGEIFDPKSRDFDEATSKVHEAGWQYKKIKVLRERKGEDVSVMVGRHACDNVACDINTIKE
jgi:hypothetical protein